jgi:hypothetical protein
MTFEVHDPALQAYLDGLCTRALAELKAARANADKGGTEFVVLAFSRSFPRHIAAASYGSRNDLVTALRDLADAMAKAAAPQVRKLDA